MAKQKTTITALKLTRYLNKLLDVKNIEDYGPNGMQINAKKTISKIGLATDSSLHVINEAKKLKCDLLLVHHGVKWTEFKDTTGLKEKKIDLLKKNGINLYASHLPLDAHSEYGNNIQLARLFNLEHIQGFGESNGTIIGKCGNLPKAKTMEELAREVGRKLRTKVKAYSFGKKNIKSLAICSGGGAGKIFEAFQQGFDCILTGETNYHMMVDAKDYGMNVIAAGHYFTETLGVQALGKHIMEKFEIPAVFIDAPIID